MPVSNFQKASHLKALHIMFTHALQQSTVWAHIKDKNLLSTYGNGYSKGESTESILVYFPS